MLGRRGFGWIWRIPGGWRRKGDVGVQLDPWRYLISSFFVYIIIDL
jgi:hypothetical protein